MAARAIREGRQLMEGTGSTSSKKLDYKRELKDLYGPRTAPLRSSTSPSYRS
jgi:hypothetical protein